MPAKLYVIDTAAERRDHKRLQEIRAALLAHSGAVGHHMAAPSEDIGDDLAACNEHVGAMFKLIDEAAVIVDSARPQP